MRLRYLTPAVLAILVLVLGVVSPSWAQNPGDREEPTPSYQRQATDAGDAALGPVAHGANEPLPLIPLGVSPPIQTIEAINFDDNATETGGWVFIPPDPIAAAGPDHLVNVVNVCIEWYDKTTGVRQHRDALRDFFGPTPLGTFCFDPKVIYDQHAGRFVVVALEQTDTYYGDPADDSYVLVAVSKTSNPNDGWWFHSIHSKTNIGGADSWADYPGLAVDDKAVYITSNMFAFVAGGGGYQSMRLWVIDKGLAGGFYAGGAAAVTVYDPYAASGYAGYESTTQPAHMFGAPPTGQSGNPLGTWLVAYSGWTTGGAGGTEYLLLIEVDDPLGGAGGPYFYQQWRSLGDIEDIGGSYGWPSLPDAPQLGTAHLIEVNDRRALNAVWRDNKLYMSTTINPRVGPDAGQTTAHWVEMGTTAPASITLDDQGNVGAEDVGANTYTFFPSVMVNQFGDMAVAFSASNSGIYPSACYTGREPGDPAGTVQGTNTFAPGTDWYYRAFGGSHNRWGDFSGLSLCPTDEATFWAFNEYAIARGTVISGEDGRWGTRYAAFQITTPSHDLYVSGPTGSDITGDGSLANPFKTITYALSLASAGDSVKVLPGTYSPWVADNEETLPLIMVNGVTLTGVNGPGVTILDAVRESRVIECSGLDNTTTIEGFTVRRGRVQGGSSADDDDGGGIFCSSSSPNLKDLVLDRNDAADRGGAMCFKDDCMPIIEGCVFFDNRAATGGGIYADGSSTIDVMSCTMSDNTANGSSGGGIAVETSSSAVVENTIIAYSHGLSAQAVDCDGTSTATLTCCDVYNNQGGDWVGCLAGQAPAGGTNFSADPNFCDRPNRDLHIWMSSPCAPGLHPNGQPCGLIGALPVNCSFPVPVELADFSATAVDEGILLEWRLTGLSGADAFKVHRSSDGSEGHYLVISGELWAGDGTEAKQFSYLDSNVIPGTLYNYKIEAIEAQGRSVIFGPYPVLASERAVQYSLGQNAPNPFTRETGTTIEFSVPSPQKVEIRIMDVAGRLVRRLSADAVIGNNHVRWDGTDSSGRQVASGVYFYRIKARDYTSEKKMLLAE